MPRDGVSFDQREKDVEVVNNGGFLQRERERERERERRGCGLM